MRTIQLLIVLVGLLGILAVYFAATGRASFALPDSLTFYRISDEKLVVYRGDEPVTGAALSALADQLNSNPLLNK